MKKILIIAVFLMFLFLNIPGVANAASVAAPALTTKTTSVTPATSTTFLQVNFDSRGGSEVAGLSVEYNGKAVAPKDPTRTGYTFGGWYKDNTTFANLFDFETTAISENITLYAKWTINNYSVTFNTQGGSLISDKRVDYNNAIVTPTKPTKTGYTFGGWYKETGCINAWNFTTDKITANTTLYAKWIVVIKAGPTGLTASSTGYSSINIKWNTVTGASGYVIYRSTSSSGNYTLISSTTKANYNNTGLTTGSIYYYKVKSYRMSGKVKTYSSFSTTISSKSILAAPTSFKTTRLSSKSIKLTWSVSAGANGYEVYNATSSTGAYKLLTKTTSSSYTNSNLITGKTYYYRLRSYRIVGKTRVYSNWNSIASKIITNVVYNNLVQSNAVYGKYAGLKVEILDETSNRFLLKKPNSTQMWVACNKVSVPKNPATNTKYMDKKQLETYVNITSAFVSNTKYFTWVDLNRQRVNIFTGSAGHWVLLKSYSCGTGNNITPSKRGLFTIQDKGYSFSAGSGYIVKYWTRYSGYYMLHSVILTNFGKVADGTVGKRVSHGCIRMPLDMAKWYYEKMPRGSLIWVN